MQSSFFFIIYYVQNYSLWLLNYFVAEDWNISSLIDRPDREELLICRTNGALERFNRELNQAFPHSHPTMTDFVTTIRRISHEKYEK